MEDKAQHKLLEWLTTVNYATQQGEYFKRRQEGTGKWLLGTDKFQQWINNENKNILCTGIPGAGKTMLTAIVIKHLEEKCEHDRSVGLAYIYCNFRRHHEQSVDNILASLIKQLCQRMSFLPEDIKTLYAQHKKRQTRPELDELFESLSVLLGHFSKIFIVVDALDEYSSRDEALRRLLSELFRLQSNSTQEIFAAAEDVEAYLRDHMSDLSRVVLGNNKLQDEIVEAIMKTVDGMFLLAQLHLDSLRGKLSVTAVKKTLEKLPTGTDAYDVAYEEAMERINGKTAGERELAFQILAWITCARVPLKIEQLQYGLAVEPDEAEFDPDNLPDAQDMVAICAGLVTIDENCRIIRLVHHTAQEYLERSQTKWFPRAHYDMARACMAYLLHSVQPRADLLLEDMHFSGYCTQNWGYHFQLALAEPGLVHSLLRDKKKVWNCAQALMTSRGEIDVIERHEQMPETVTEAHLVAYLGPESALRELIKAGYPYDALDATNRSPLFWAAENGQEGAARVLIEQGLVPDQQDQWGFTPLALAAKYGHFEVGDHHSMFMSLLDHGADSNLTDQKIGRPPLVWAAQRDLASMVEALLSRGVDADSQDRDGWTALSYATSTPLDHKESGDEVLVKQILESGSNPKAHGTHIKGSLAATTRRDYEGVVKLLLQYKANPDAVNRRGWSPLILAAARGQGNTVRSLLDTGNVDPKRQDEYGHDAAHYARKYGHDQIALLLSSSIKETNVAIKESVCTADQPENTTFIAPRAT
ncbi:hypothetical protein AtubIFM55763_003304 [Aspergillus tubingensis]|uniref:NACHT domain-containing protein n=1 Tax=Aspergillus tubingensis TaxID=5068 RepID=A0A9W6AV30_ASPTU|nr:hypothetical protein AtubIFM54640_006263 [Aspergillus tubingensis]GLA68235.1 hypothetical protein AtubIFM55763_003304 [Aspergillus tubingensis]GLA86225.1 hypothetical protein AtubIFM56815_010481 [Aspergillus tubingensis]